MRTAIRKYRAPALALLFTIVLGLIVGGYILSNQRFYLPSWVPVIGSDFVDYKAEFENAQAVTPGQGQTVNIAGVPVGEIDTVELKDGVAVVGMKIRRKYTDEIYRDATATLRPKSGLSDMIVQLDPGSRKSGVLKRGGTIPLPQTQSNTNLDELLSAVDGDTRDYLRLLLAGAGEGLDGEGKNLSAALRRLAPINRDLAKAMGLLSERRQAIRRGITNLGLVMDAVGSKDRQLAQLIDSSNVTLRALASQDQKIRESLRLLPGTLALTDRTLAKTGRLARLLGPTAQELRTGARALPGTMERLRPFFRETTPVIRERLRPFARDVLPTVELLRPTADDLAATAPDLTSTLKTVNFALNVLAHNPRGDDEGYGYYLAWINHLGAQTYSGQDAHGPFRRGAALFSCETIQAAEATADANPQLNALIGLANPVSVKRASEGDSRCDPYERASDGTVGRR